MKPKYRLDPADVTVSIRNGVCENRKGQFSKKSRANGLSSCTVVLIHKPTGVDVTGEIPMGYYSRQEMIRRRAQLSDKLLVELEKEVSAFLRVPGR